MLKLSYSKLSLFLLMLNLSYTTTKSAEFLNFILAKYFRKKQFKNVVLSQIFELIVTYDLDHLP